MGKLSWKTKLKVMWFLFPILPLGVCLYKYREGANFPDMPSGYSVEYDDVPGRFYWISANDYRISNKRGSNVFTPGLMSVASVNGYIIGVTVDVEHPGIDAGMGIKVAPGYFIIYASSGNVQQGLNYADWAQSLKELGIKDWVLQRLP